MVDKCPGEKQSLEVGMRDLWVFTNRVIGKISLKEMRKQPCASRGESIQVAMCLWSYTSLYLSGLLSTPVYHSRRVKHGLMSMFISYLFRHLTKSIIKSLCDKHISTPV